MILNNIERWYTIHSKRVEKFILQYNHSRHLSRLSSKYTVLNRRQGIYQIVYKTVYEFSLKKHTTQI